MSSVYPDKDTQLRDMAREVAREEIQRALSSPIDFPQELKNWIPAQTSIQGLQIPFSDIVGAYVTATTVSGLGPGVHGRTGMVQAGSSPYDYVQVTYDAVYGKWVSNPMTAALQKHGPSATDYFTTTSTTYVTTENVARAVFPYRTYYNAGLALQVRHIAKMNITGSQTASQKVVLRLEDFLASSSTDVNPAGLEITAVLTGTPTIVDSGWVDAGITAGNTKDTVHLLVEAKTSNGANAMIALVTSVWIRWVSQ